MQKIENWKHYNKIIFKCVNSTVGPSFNIVFGEKSTCGSYEQCTELTFLIINADTNQNLAVSKLLPSDRLESVSLTTSAFGI